MTTKDTAQPPLELVAQTLFDKKGFNILALDVRTLSSLTDFILIGEGNVDRHIQALGNTVIDTLKDQGLNPLYVEGMQTGDWIVLDYGDFMVHLFTPDMRDKYRLETLWTNSKIVSIKLKQSQEEKEQ